MAAKQTIERYGDRKVLSLEWTAEPDGTFTDFLTMDIGGGISKVKTIPGSPAPTDGYSITLIDDNGFEVMGVDENSNGTMSSLSNSATEVHIPATYQSSEDTYLYHGVFVDGALTLQITGNIVAGAAGVIKIYYI